MKKIYSLMLLMAALICLPWSAKAVTVFEEDFEGDLSKWTQQSCKNSSTISSEAKYNGQKGFMFDWNTNPPQYLISKELSIPANVSDLSLEFYYKAYKSSYTESFKVGYSTTTNDVTGEGVFTWEDEVSVTSTTFAKYTSTVTIPADVKYIAIAYTANDKYKLYIDDIKLTCTVSGPSMAVYDGESSIANGANYSFGLVTAGTTKTFTLKNEGTEAAPVSVAHTGSFGAELSAASIPAGGEVTLTVTMPETSGEDVITISSTSNAIEDFVINVSGTVRDASKLYETLLGGALPEDWSTTGTWSWSTTNGATNTTWYEANNYRLITPLLIVAEGETFIFEAKGNYSGYHGMKFEYSADGTNWTASSTTTTLTADWQTFTINDIPAGKYYVAIHGWYMSVRNFYGGTLPAKVKDVAATGVTDSEATIGWTKHGSETAWQVSYNTTSGDPDNGTIVDADANSKTITGLSATTTYYVSVRIGSTGVWSNEISFTTACAAETAPKKWNFEDETVDAIPSCWDNSGSGSATISSSAAYYIWGVYQPFGSNNKVLRMYNSMIQDGTALINTPRIEIPASPAYELVFEYSHVASCGAFTVKVSEDGANWTDLGSYTNESGTNSTSVGEFTEATIDLSSYAGKTILLQFFATADYDNGAIFIDNVEVRAKSNCPSPKSVVVSAVTAHTASVAWTEKGEATAWKLQTSKDGENWSEEIAADANPFTLTGLEAQTTYYVRVKAICSESESSDWSDASEAFTTQCETATLPFDTVKFDAIPACWNVPSAWTIYTYDGHSGSTSIRVKSTTASLISPAIELSEKAQLSFYLSGSNSVRCLVYVNDGEGEVQVGEATSTTSWKQATVDLSAYVGKTVNIIFRSSSASFFLYIDDVAINYAPVAAPTELAVEAGDQQATISWTNIEEDATYNLRHKATAAEEWTIVNGVTNPYVLGSLTNNTEYEVQVQAVASANRVSEWTESATFTPVACASIETVTFGDKTYNSVVVNWTATAAGKWEVRYKAEGDADYTVAGTNLTDQTITLNGLKTNVAYTIEVKAACSEEWKAAEALTLHYSSPTNITASNIEDVTATLSWDAVADAPDGYKYIVVARGAEVDWTNAEATDALTAELSELSGLTDYDFYVAALYGENLGTPVKAEFATIAIAPANLTAGEITTTTATFTWVANGAATQYQWSTDGENWSAAQKELTATATGLTAATTYTFYVRSYYAEGKYSEPVTLGFTTACGVYNLPFEENFDNGQLNCWTTDTWSENSAAGAWSLDNNYSHSGFTALRFNAKTDETGVISSPEIALGQKAELSFFLRNVYGANNAGYVGGKVIAADVENEENKVEAEFIQSNAENLTEQKLDLSALLGKTVKITFLATGVGTSTNASLYIDDVKVTVKPDDDPTAIGNTSAAKQVIKTIENDQMVIIIDGVKYNAQGQKL